MQDEAPAEASLQFLDLAVDEQTLALGVSVELAGFFFGREFFEARDALPDILEIGQGAADPARRTEGLARALGRLADDLMLFVLAADEEDLAALLAQALQEGARRF